MDERPLSYMNSKLVKPKLFINNIGCHCGEVSFNEVRPSLET